MRHALRLCPDLTVGRTDWQRIHACSRAVMEVLARFGVPAAARPTAPPYGPLTSLPAGRRTA